MFKPAVREELIKLTSFQRIYSGENIGHVSERVDAVLLGRNNKGKMDGGSLATFVRTSEQKIFASQNELLNGAFTGIVADIEIGIVEKSRQSNPVSKRIFDGIHQRVFGTDSGLQLQQSCFQLIKKRFRLSLSFSKSFVWRLAFNLIFDLVNLIIYIENLKANIGVEMRAFEVSAA